MYAFFESGEAWNQHIAQLPGAHLLQTWEWSQLKAQYGWEPMPHLWRARSGGGPAAAAMILRKQLRPTGVAARLSLLYCPKGPILDWSDAPLRSQVLGDLQELSRREHAIFLKIDPDVAVAADCHGDLDHEVDASGEQHVSDLRGRGWRYSSDQVQFKNTVVIDLRRSDDELLEQMKPKTRYNIRLAAKKGVQIRPGTPDDFPAFFRMYAETAVRDGFAIRDERYYNRVWGSFMSAPIGANHRPWCESLIAEVDGQPIAGLFVYFFAGRAYYLYGMSMPLHRERMPNHLLQWAAIRLARTRGAAVYDLWGAPDRFAATDKMWGVFRFKEGLGGRTVCTAGAWDFVPRPLWYTVYTRAVPRLLGILRASGSRRVRQTLDA